MVSIREDESTLTQEYIERRVNDWEKRYNQLVEQIKSWLEPDSGLQLVEFRSVQMYEYYQHKYELPAIYLNSALIKAQGEPCILIYPQGLWFIGGTNGMVVLSGPEQRFKLIDDTWPFRDSNWKIYWEGIKPPIPFTRFIFTQIIQNYV